MTRFKWNGSALREWRECRGYSLKDLSELVGFSKSAISRWERDDHIPLAPYFYKLMRVTKLSDELFVEDK